MGPGRCNPGTFNESPGIDGQGCQALGESGFSSVHQSVGKEENEPEMSLVMSLAKTTAAKFQLVMMHGWDDELLSPVLLLPLF